ncbi:MAG: lasso RiPP family leader peptide-containing protein [Terriglobales bacterium]
MNNKENSQAALKPYSIPRLVVYGDVRVVTQTIGSGLINDTQMSKSA